MSSINIDVSGDNNALSVNIDIPGYQNHESTVIGKQQLPQLGEVISNWLGFKFRPIYERMPLDSFDIHCHDALINTFEPQVQNAIILLGNTNTFIAHNKHLEGVADSFENILFFNCGDDLRYKSLYEYLQKTLPNLKYLNMDLGFDRVKRKWIGAPPPMEFEELIHYLIDNKIKKIFTINHYLLDRYIAGFGIFLIPVCEFMGIEFCNIDHDPPDLRPSGYLHKAWHCSSGAKFSCKSILQKYWDELYNIKTHYVAIPQNYSDTKFRKLDPDYDVVVLTNSRWDDVCTFKDHIVWLLDRLSGLRELHIWYLAMREMALNKDITEFEKLYTISSLHTLMYMARNYYKYMVINNININRKITVYGDEGWENVCPEIYGGSLDNAQIQKLNAENNHLYLLINPSYSYLDASGPLYDMIQRGLPFVNIAPVFKTDTFAGMKPIEYDNNVSELLDNYQMPDCEAYRNILDSSTQDIELILSGNKPNDIFNQHLMEHEEIINREVADFMSVNGAFLRSSYKRLLG